MVTYADKRRRAAKHEFAIGDKVLVNQLHNKKVFNKIKSKAANEVFVIKAIKGSIITVFSGDREFTRNVYLFKKAPDGMENNIELPIEFFSCSNSNNSNQINDSNSNQNNHQIIEIDT